MSRSGLWIALVGSAVLAVGFLVWSLGGRDSTGAGPEQHATEPGRDAGPALVSPVELRTVDKAQREEVLVARDEAAPDEGLPGPGEALLRVLIVARESGEPLVGIAPSLMPAEAQGWSTRGAHGPRGTLRETPLTGEDGLVEFLVPALADYRLRIFERDMSRVDLRIPALADGEQRELTIELITEPDLVFSGEVVSDHDGTPLDQAVVRFGGHRGLTDERIPVNAAGCFHLTTASWKSTYLQVSMPGYSDRFVTVVVGHTRPEEAMVIRLERVARLAVSVRGIGGVGLSRVLVRATTKSHYLFEDRGQSVLGPRMELEWGEETDADGNCELTDLPPGVPLTLELKQPGKFTRREDAPIELLAGETRRLELEIGTGIALHGVVIDQHGQPARRLEIWMKPAVLGERPFFHNWEKIATRTLTNSEGVFVRRDVAPGEWFVGPAASPNSIAPVATRVEVLAEPFEQHCRIFVQRGLYISGRLLDQDEAPVSDVHLSAHLQRTPAAGEVGPRFFASGISKLDGTFVIGPVPEGWFDVIAGGSRSWRRVTTEAQGGDSDLILHMRAGCEAAGVVRDLKTHELVTARVSIRPIIGDTWRGSNTRDGRFEFSGLDDGLHYVTARTPDGRFGILRSVPLGMDTPIEDLEVFVRPAGQLVCKYEGNSKHCMFDVLLGSEVVGAGYFDQEPVVRLAVPPGELTIRFSAGGTERETRTVEVAIGEEQELVFH